VTSVVLVVTHWFDPTADHVVEELGRRGVPVFRFDAADFPRRLVVTGTLDRNGWVGSLRLGGRVADLADVAGIYFRRPTAFSFGAMPEAAVAWARAEARSGLGGLLMAQRRWLNHPRHIGYAEYKPVQLAEAADAGLRVPKTLITSDPAEASRFADGPGKVIYKPLSPALPPGDTAMLYTSAVEPAHLAGDGAGIAATMHLFQERVPTECAVRLTVIDGRMFAVSIRSALGPPPLDWRAEQDKLAYGAIDVPPNVELGVQALMSALRLRFGALDFLVTPSGDWVFLEVNPNGQWAFLPDADAIAAAIADSLTRQVAADGQCETGGRHG
jgi:ATP-grasp ribosomal peptide maturase